jgi:hypothetical protein
VSGQIRATGPGARAAALAALLLCVYASTLGLDAFLDSDYGGDEPHYLLSAESLVEDGDVDVLDEYRSAQYADFYPYDLDQHGEPRDGSVREPHGAGFPALIVPALALGGPGAVELLLAALATGCVALGYLLARRVTGDPWALLAALAVGLSPPLLAYGTAVYPELAAGAALAGAALLAVWLTEFPSRAGALGCAALIAVLPWLGTKFLPAGLVVGVFAVRALRSRGQRLLAVGGLTLVAISAIAYVLVNQALYDGPTPYAADEEGETATDASFPLGYLERAYRLAALFVDRDYGLLRWAPVFALGLVGVWLLSRRRGGGIPGDSAGADERARTAATLCAAALLAQLLVAAFLAPTMFGFWFPPRHLLAALPLATPLVALGLRRLPRAGAVLAAIGVAGSVWVWLAVRLGQAGLAADRPDAPFGPLDAVFPLYGDAPLPYIVTAVAAVAVLVLLVRAYADRARAAARHARQSAGVTRRRYSG